MSDLLAERVARQLLGFQVGDRVYYRCAEGAPHMIVLGYDSHSGKPFVKATGGAVWLASPELLELAEVPTE